MKKCLVAISVILFVILMFFAMQLNAQNKIQFKEDELDYPDVPRVLAYEAFVKYKAGKAIILHGGGEVYNRRHILGAINMDYKDEIKDKLLPKFPKDGIEIFTYCY